MIKNQLKNYVLSTFIFITVIALSCNKPSDSSNQNNSTSTLKITNITPATGTAGVQVIIEGENFSSQPGNNTVKFNGVTASVLSATPTKLTVIAPTGAMTGKITVTVNNQTASSSNDFVFRVASLNAPVITSFFPIIAHPGETLRINGNHFKENALLDTVRINGLLAKVTSTWDSTSLFVEIPLNATTGFITVTTRDGVALSSDVFTVLPIISSTVSTFAGNGLPGSTDGPALTAQFNYPVDIAIDSTGNLYVVDAYGQSLRKISASGIVSTLTKFTNPMSSPAGLCVDKSGNIYVADNVLNTIFKVTNTGMVSTLAGTGPNGYKNGIGTSASFHSPLDVAVDASGNVFVADYENNRIRKITPQGNVTTFAGDGKYATVDGQDTSASFYRPSAITIDAAGNLYVGETSKIRKITPAGVVTTIAGVSPGGFMDGFTYTALFTWPRITVDGVGNIYAANRVLVQKIYGNLVNTIAGNGKYGYAEGSNFNASFNYASGIAVDKSGTVYVTDNLNHRIRKITF